MKEKKIKKIKKGMFVFDENVPFKEMAMKLQEMGFKSISITETDLRKSKDVSLANELKKYKDIIVVTCDSQFYWKCCLNRIPCIFLSIEGALLNVFTRNVKRAVHDLKTTEEREAE